MKKSIFKHMIVAILVLIIATASLLTACTQPKDTTVLGIMSEKKEAYKGDTIKMTVFVRPEGEYTLSASPANLVTINGDNVTFTGDIEVDTDVTITATLKSNSNVKDSCVVKYKAPAKPDVKTKITIEADAKTAVKGDTVNFTVVVEPEADYVLTASSEHSSLVVIKNNNSATFVGDITLDQFITFTATLVDDNTVKSSVGVTFKAPVKEGQVGELTSDMIQAIGNSAITVKGTVTDYVVDFNNASRNSADTMDMVVKMEDGKWYGEWYYQAEPENAIKDSFVRGEGIVSGFDGTQGNPLLQVYVNKNNEVAYKTIKNYLSLPATWQSQHYWNHLAQLDIETFEYDAEHKLYTHKLDVRSESDLYLMTYIAYSMTPMLEDTFDSISFMVEGGQIVGMVAQTEILYDRGATSDPKEASMMSYTRVEVLFSEVGTTSVPAIETYQSPENADLLEAALQQMREATNYTFKSKETTTSSPDINWGDYELESTSARDYTSSTGTVGTVGYVTEDAILLEITGKYSASMDGKDYHVAYSGYKQNDDNTYDYFSYSASDNALKGTKKINGTLADILPKFDFSASVFELFGVTPVKGGNLYTFVLRDGTITRDISMEISMDSYAKDGANSTNSRLTIVVDDKGNLVSTKFPYSIVGGSYRGYIETSYSNMNSTVLADDVFDGYIPRAWNNSWADFTCKYYTSAPGIEQTHDENALTVFEAVFPGMTVPTPNMFRAIFDDNIYVFFEYVEKKDGNGNYLKDESGKYILDYTYIAINTRYEHDLDENDRITDINAVFDMILDVFSVQGYVKDRANSGAKYGNNYLTIISETTGLQIVFESNGTKNIFIEIYKLGQWTLK